MWKGYYGKEPFNLRLTVLRMFRQLPVIAGLTFLGTLVFGGGYYGKNVWLRDESFYAVTSCYRVEYAVENVEDMMNVFINEMSWNTYMQSQMFLDAVRGHLAQEDGTAISDEELAGTIRAQVLSDIRIPSTVVTTDSPEKSLWIARAVETAMTQELAAKLSEVASMSVMDPGDKAVEILPDVRPARAFLLSLLLSLFFAVTVLLLKETGDDSIWLPESLWKRYGVKVVGTVESRELAEHMRYLFPRRPGEPDGRIALCGVQEEMDPEAVLESLKHICPDTVDGQWFAVPSPLREPEGCRQLREAEGILLAVKAGRHAGRTFERVLELLGQQDCHVTATLLWEADEKLLSRYDWRGRKETIRRG